ncbi:MAG: ABC transporter permease [Candidatus Thermoplasmatota archaeon]|jgi:ABC-type dipeptide/oligopeptide/nickel transport system permease subunit|nr:ABC transporter permease [Candidatus Sysuiplasma jiujiangense]MBX8640716.1 ABC transporter permease [Candidatus Sysuiplasma jiujiangense]MBX8642580.1 ABC transporter permease [Candidatus Sysuiplasma jiujiangense]MCL4317382.1 ABC transporter permease [Candidatus Thermoplasmatota archaeon]
MKVLHFQVKSLFKRNSRFKFGLSNIWFILRSNPLSIIGLVLVMAYVVAALAVLIFGNSVLPYNPYRILTGKPFLPPGPKFLFGTDELGRDVFSRTLDATPLDLGIGLSIGLIAMFIGGTVGMISGYLGGKADTVIMRITDVFLSFPTLVLALAVAVLLGPSVIHSIEALSVIWWTAYARLARGQTLSAKNQLYVVAARAAGVSEIVILFRHILRNIFDTLIIYLTMDIGTVILTFSTLSFLGVGVPSPIPEWGRMVFRGESFIFQAPWIALAPGFAIFFAVFAFSLLGDALRELLDPRARKIIVR